MLSAGQVALKRESRACRAPAVVVRTLDVEQRFVDDIIIDREGLRATFATDPVVESESRAARAKDRVAALRQAALVAVAGDVFIVRSIDREE